MSSRHTRIWSIWIEFGKREIKDFDYSVFDSI